jgi:two-component system response regulator FixJ
MNAEDHRAPPSGSSLLRSAGSRIRDVYIVEDDPEERRVLSRLLESAECTVKSFGSADSLLATVNRKTAGVLILDHSLENMSGLALQAELGNRGVGLKIIFISGCGVIGEAVSAIKEGAIDFIEKPYTDKQLLDSVEEALLLVNAEEKKRRRRDTLDNRYERLTPRELEIMGFLVKGESSRKLAQRLGLSSRTVDIHRSRIMHKLEADSLPELVRLVCSSRDYLPEEVLIDIRQTSHFQDGEETG